MKTVINIFLLFFAKIHFLSSEESENALYSIIRKPQLTELLVAGRGAARALFRQSPTGHCYQLRRTVRARMPIIVQGNCLAISKLLSYFTIVFALPPPGPPSLIYYTSAMQQTRPTRDTNKLSK